MYEVTRLGILLALLFAMGSSSGQEVTFDGVRTCSIVEVAEWTCSAVVGTPQPDPEPDPVPDVIDWSACIVYLDGYACAPENAVDPHPGFTVAVEPNSGGWLIYTRIEGTPDPAPNPNPTPDPGPTPNPNPTPSGVYIGVPLPAFGLTETVVDNVATHWIDNSGSCSDSGNGTEAQPRCSIPSAFSAGSIIQIRGGPYSEMEVTFNGTASNPIFFRGPTGGLVSLPGREGLDISGSYAIIENVDINRVKIEFANNIAIRDSYIHDPVPRTGGMIGINGNNLVFLRNEVARNGLVTDTKDSHGFNIGGGAFNIWILDNNIHHNGGDGIQFCHSCVALGDGGPRNLYIANNRIHEDKENAIDLKEFSGLVVISGNDMYGYFRITSGQGETIRVNDEGNQGELWIINNNIHNSNVCIGPEGSDADSYAVDNKCNQNNFGIGSGLTDQAGNLTNGVVDDANVERLYALFQSRHGLDIRPQQ